MAGPHKKRPIEGRLQRPSKKQKRKQEYHSESEEDEFDAVNLLDSDDDIHNATVDDAAPESAESSGSEDEKAASKPKKTMRIQSKQLQKAQEESEEESSEEDDEDASDDDDDEDRKSSDKKSKSKRNDPDAFANSLSKILSTKLSSSKRADPVLARSAEAHQASRAAQDSALETKARKKLREQKKQAMERGRVKDVLVATRNESTGELETTTTEIMETERRLRKVAQRGVVKLFNAVRAAQVAAVEAEKGTKKAGVIGMGQREGKVNELSKKGFLDLIASGGGGLKKTALEEA